MAWSILGQASGAYVGPTCWAVLFLMAAAAILHQRTDRPDYSWQPLATGGFYGYGAGPQTGMPPPAPLAARGDLDEPEDVRDFHPLADHPPHDRS
jgi:hypothetical protein